MEQPQMIKSLSTKLHARSYLGSKGYTIYKSDLATQELDYIKRQLTIQPSLSNQYQQDRKPFAVYRENQAKIYIPRYFAEGTPDFPGLSLGPAKIDKLPEGDTIDIPFEGSLRPEQEIVTNHFCDFVSAKSSGGGGLLSLPCAAGKTVLSLNIISRLRRKTLVVVHKEFLLNQWIERASQFLPTARIGRIQASVIDIDDKDIVIGMLQSLSMKTYEDEIFQSFGFTIIDEVHHISSEIFSCALFRMTTRYTLGLSATMDRKDGTSYVFKLFLGSVLYRGEAEQHAVQVRAIQFENKCDDAFNAVINDSQGKIQYSSMITKLCDHVPRSEFILGIVQDMIEEADAQVSAGGQQQQQIMILAHNKSLLTYLFTAIKERGMATVGYYVGGMKPEDLKESEKARVIIATYSMAAEALDIKTLNTLIMATPKTDIEQAVGRILRERHGTPIVVDIVDPHAPFRQQWKKRQEFYRKKGYEVTQSDYVGYITKKYGWNKSSSSSLSSSSLSSSSSSLPKRQKCR